METEVKMIDKKTVFEIHRLNSAGLSNRAIAEKLRVDRGTVASYLENPFRSQKRKPQPKKLDPYLDEIKELYEEYPKINAPVVLRKIREKGYDGEITLVRAELRRLKRENGTGKAFIRFESAPGEQMQADWGHFATISYGDIKRKLFALAVIESHSRMLYVCFTHSQKQEVLHQCLLNAFRYFGGTPKELVVDNMLTAVTERVGSLIRFNDSFLEFMMRFGIEPFACNVRAPHEKGKVESSIKYLRNNFMPTRTFTDLTDANDQVLCWLRTVANVRKHKTTGQQPVKRLNRKALTPIADPLPDCRETGSYRVHKDCGVRFDGNVYTAPAWAVGKRLTLKADEKNVWLFDKERILVTHPRSWLKHLWVEHPGHTATVMKKKRQHHFGRQTEIFLSLGESAYIFLENLTRLNSVSQKQIEKLLQLKDDYGEKSLIYAMEKAISKNLYGADYIENILYQEMTPEVSHPPVLVEKKELNDIRLKCTSLKEYDALAVKRKRKKNG